MTELLYDTLTKSEIDRARATRSNSSTPTPVLERACRHCGGPLKDRQKSACSPACARMLGAHRVRSAAAERRKTALTKTTVATSLSELLAVLPAEVTAVELNNGWRCTRV
jgi:hypothetical protein